jgi:hypothetical protein
MKFWPDLMTTLMTASMSAFTKLSVTGRRPRRRRRDDQPAAIAKVPNANGAQCRRVWRTGDGAVSKSTGYRDDYDLYYVRLPASGGKTREWAAAQFYGGQSF